MIRSIGVGTYIYSKEDLVSPKFFFKVSQLGLDCSRKNVAEVQYYNIIQAIRDLTKIEAPISRKKHYKNTMVNSKARFPVLYTVPPICSSIMYLRYTF